MGYGDVAPPVLFLQELSIDVLHLICLFQYFHKNLNFMLSNRWKLRILPLVEPSPASGRHVRSPTGSHSDSVGWKDDLSNEKHRRYGIFSDSWPWFSSWIQLHILWARIIWSFCGTSLFRTYGAPFVKLAFNPWPPLCAGHGLRRCRTSGAFLHELSINVLHLICLFQYFHKNLNFMLSNRWKPEYYP